MRRPQMPKEDAIRKLRQWKGRLPKLSDWQKHGLASYWYYCYNFGSMKNALCLAEKDSNVLAKPGGKGMSDEQLAEGLRTAWKHLGYAPETWNQIRNIAGVPHPKTYRRHFTSISMALALLAVKSV